MSMRRQQRPAGSIYTSPIKQTRLPLSDQDVNTQRTVLRDRKNSVATTYTNKWAYELDNQESSKNSKENSHYQYFQSFNNSYEQKNQNQQNALPFESFKQPSLKLSKQVEPNSNQDSLARYEKLEDQTSNDIVKKLTCLNNVFKEIKQLRTMDLSEIIQKSLAGVEDKLLAIQRAMIKDETKKQTPR